jgi:hypothetical protein
VLIGLHRVGLVGLRKAFQQAEASGLTDREAMIDFLLETLSADNYLPDPKFEPLRRALWREHLRYRGLDFSDFFAEVEVMVRGEPGPERDRFVDLTRTVFAGFELKPLISFAPTGNEGPNPQLAAGERTIVCGLVDQRTFQTAVRQSFTDW